MKPTSSNPPVRKSAADSAQTADPGYSRLHIAPLDPSLVKVIVPAAVLPNARHISYHTTQTFPDRPFGFVELPTADADKIKKKLNGATLRGSKIRIELARADNMPKPSPEALEDPLSKNSKTAKKQKKDRKRKRDHNEIAGIELEEGRKVKRGWTVTPEEAQAQKEKEQIEERKQRKSKKADKDSKKDRKDKEKRKKRKAPESIYSGVPECLVKTQLPPNKLDIVDSTAGDDKKKSKKYKTREVVVHEFEKNTKFPTFLKSSATAPASDKEETTFVKGKGWVDDSGKVVEEVKSTRPTEFPKMVVETTQIIQPKEALNDDTSSSEDNSSSDDESDEEEEDKKKDENQPSPAKGLSLKTESTTAPQSPPAAAPTEAISAVPESASSPKSLTINIPPTTPTSGPSQVHPLEALYKRPKEGQAATTTKTTEAEPFSFFGGYEEDDEEENGLGEEAIDHHASDDDQLEVPGQASQAPMTPYTERDMEWRNLRSAAPTPDTAHPSRISRFWPLKGDNPFGSSSLQEEDEEDNEDAPKGASDPNTDFQGWFWEHRGDLNRAWKKRRKLAAKEKRYRDNKARAARAI